MNPKGIKLLFFICLNLLIDLIPKIIGTMTACKCAKNNIKKNKLIKYLNSFQIQNKDLELIYLKREIYHCPKTKINKVATRGKAGYLVLKFAGGQGDHEISLSFSSFDDFNFVVF